MLYALALRHRSEELSSETRGRRQVEGNEESNRKARRWNILIKLLGEERCKYKGSPAENGQAERGELIISEDRS
jgi:hypothetical protein